MACSVWQMRSLSAFGEGFKAVTVKREQRRTHREGKILRNRFGNIAKEDLKDRRTTLDKKGKWEDEYRGKWPKGFYLYILHCNDSRGI